MDDFAPFNDTFASIKWEGYGGKYRIKLNSDERESDKPIFHFKDLNQATKYDVKIRVESKEFGISEWSDPVLTFSTPPSQLTGKYL